MRKGNLGVTTARELQKAFREREEKKVSLRAKAVKAVLIAAAAVAAAEADKPARKAKLRKSTAAAVAVERKASAGRIAQMRDRLAEDLADVEASAGTASEAEVVAGRAVLAAMHDAELAKLGGAFREKDLAKGTNVRLGLLRRWVEAARAADQDGHADLSRNGVRGAEPTSADGAVVGELRAAAESEDRAGSAGRAEGSDAVSGQLAETEQQPVDGV